MCLAQGTQRSDAGEARTRGPSVSSQALYHWATVLPPFVCVTVFVTWFDNWNIVDYADQQQRKPIYSYILNPRMHCKWSYISIYMFYIQLIVIDPYRSRSKKGMIFGIKD